MAVFKTMTAAQIRKAVDEGHTVYADSFMYRVIKDSKDQYMIVCGTYCIGLTWQDGRTLNAEKFHIHTPKKQEGKENVEGKEIISNFV
jgi:hypothetical protein